jgi:hypothetical protein
VAAKKAGGELSCRERHPKFGLAWYNQPMLKKEIQKRNLQDLSTPKSDLAFWLKKSPEERVAAVDFLRRQYYGTPTGLQRVARVVQRPRG